MCMHACVGASVRARTCMCVCACVYVHVCMCVHFGSYTPVLTLFCYACQGSWYNRSLSGLLSV